jgi:16S rRNA processing protein RimM
LRAVALGRIGAPHGVRGWCRVQSWTRPHAAILEFERWLVGDGDERRVVHPLEGRETAKGLVVRLAECGDRDAVTALRHATVAVPRDELPELADGEWYWADLEGLRVETSDGVDLGRVDHLLETGANDVLVVRGDRERLIPWETESVVVAVEPDADRLVVDWDPEV